MLINAGSFSRLDVFETCKKHAELKFVHKIPEPDRGPHPKGEWPNDRGSRIHDECEAYVKGEREKISVEAKDFKAELEKLHSLYQQDQVFTEEMWCFDEAWVPCDQYDYDSIAFRVKTDITVFLSETSAVIIDYKTGRRYGNEYKHAQQMKLYAVGAILRYPDLREITTELWYLDQKELADMTFTAMQAKKMLKDWNARNQEMMNCDEFPANPSKTNCRWCPYSIKGTGDCEVGVV